MNPARPRYVRDVKSGISGITASLLFVTACSGSSPTTSTEPPMPSTTSSPTSTSSVPTTTTAPEADAPDLIITNANVITMDDAFTIASAIAVSDGVITSVGDGDIENLASESTRTIDLEGRTVIPGIVETHTHLLQVVAPDVGAMGQGQQRLLEWGVTTAGMPSVLPEQLGAFQEMDAAGDVVVRSHLYLTYNSVCGDPIPDFHLSEPFVSEPSARLAVRGVKIFADGGVCNAMTMSIPYPDTVPPDLADRFSGTGDLYVDREEISRIVADVEAAGGATVIHAAGDIAMAEALHGIDMAGPLTQPHQIHHNSLSALLDDGTLGLYGSNDLTPVVFLNRWANACDPATGDFFAQILAPEVMSVIEDRRPIADANPGIRFAWHGDAPSLPGSPLEQLFSIVTNGYALEGELCYPPRWADSPTVSIEEALRMITINAATAMGLEDRIGSIEPGKIADLTILASSPLVPDHEIGLATNRAVATIIDGAEVFCIEICSLFQLDSSVDPLINVASRPDCVSAEPDVWFPAEGSASDVVGGGEGLLSDTGTYATGVVGEAFALNDGGVVLPDPPTLSGGFTIETWVYFDANPRFDDYQTLFNNNQLFLRKNDSVERNSLAVFVTLDDGSVEPRAEGNTAIAPGVWHHVAATWDGARLVLYVNGVTVGTSDRTGPLTDTAVQSQIGEGEAGETEGVHLRGRIDELSIFEEALNPNEIHALFASGSAGKCHP